MKEEKIKKDPFKNSMGVDNILDNTELTTIHNTVLNVPNHRHDKNDGTGKINPTNLDGFPLSTSVPTSTPENGSIAFYNDDDHDLNYLYVRIGDTWIPGQLIGGTFTTTIEDANIINGSMYLFHNTTTGRYYFQGHIDGEWRQVELDQPIELLYLNASTLLVDDASVQIANNVGGWGTVMTSNNSEFSQFRFAAAGTVTIFNQTANVVNSDQDTKLCIYTSGNYTYIKNRLGSTVTVKYELTYFS